MLRTVIASLTVFLVAIPVAGEAQTPATPGQKAILVTGASTGIGRNVTERLAADGYFVYAGARKDTDLKALGGIKNVHALRLDVTNPRDIDAAVETIAKGGRGLYGLVNNAGIATVGSVTDTKQDEFDLVMAVNVVGPFRITKAFLPLIIAQKGRVVTIGSISGILASPDLIAYSMSKHAMEAFTDSLATQMSALGVQTSVIEPGNYNSQIGMSAAKRSGIVSSRADRTMYKEPDEVADAIEHALFEPNPKRRYMVVPNQHEAEITIRKEIDQLVQLNEGQAYTYDRAALAKMIDESLAKARPQTK